MRRLVTSLVLVALLVLGLSSLASARTQDPLQAIWGVIDYLREQVKLAQTDLHVSDVNGQDLGVLVSALDGHGGYLVTFLTDEEITLVFDSNSAGVEVGPSAGQIFYLESDCVGTPYTQRYGYNSGAVVSSRRLFKRTGGPVVNQQNVSVLESGVCQNQVFGVMPLYPLRDIEFPFDLPVGGPLKIERM